MRFFEAAGDRENYPRQMEPIARAKFTSVARKKKAQSRNAQLAPKKTRRKENRKTWKKTTYVCILRLAFLLRIKRKRIFEKLK